VSHVSRCGAKTGTDPCQGPPVQAIQVRLAGSLNWFGACATGTTVVFTLPGPIADIAYQNKGKRPASWGRLCKIQCPRLTSFKDAARLAELGFLQGCFYLAG
jgi:hypothetical protein